MKSGPNIGLEDHHFETHVDMPNMTPLDLLRVVDPKVLGWVLKRCADAGPAWGVGRHLLGMPLVGGVIEYSYKVERGLMTAKRWRISN